MPQEPWHPGKGAKLDRVIQLNWREVRTNESYEATRIWENFSNWGAKMTLISDELRLIANNSKSFVNGSKSYAVFYQKEKPGYLWILLLFVSFYMLF